MTSLVTIAAVAVASLIALHPAGAAQNRPADWKTWLAGEAAGFSGVVLIGRDDAIDAEMAFGLADPSAGRQNTAATRFNLGSINKTFTAISIAQLVEQGRLRLDDKLITYLPDYPNKDAASGISIRQLLTHRSGVAQFMRADFGDVSVAAMTKIVGAEPLAFEPGTRQLYSNGGYIVLGRVIEVVSGKGYSDYVNDHVYRPAGMVASGFYRNGVRADNIALPVAVAEGGRGPAPALGSPSAGPRTGNPAGGGYSTAADLFRFARALRSGRLLKPTMTRYVLDGTFAEDPKWGLALREQQAGRHRFLGNGGGAPGVNAEFRFEPGGAHSIVVLSNSSPPSATNLLTAIVDRIAGVEPTAAPPPRAHNLITPPLSAIAQNTHAITPDDVLSIRELYDVRLSPDGRQIAFVVTEPNDPRNPREPRTSNIWVVRADGREVPRPLIPSLKNANSPRWSPDGRTLAFLSDRQGGESAGDGTTQVCLLRDGAQKAVRLTSVPGGVEQYVWSPNGKMIAFVARDQATAEERARKAAGDDATAQPERDLKYSRLWLANLSDRSASQVTKQDLEIVEVAWSPAGDELALIVAPSPSGEDSNNHSLVIINRSTGEVARTLTGNVSPVTGVLRWSPDGRWMTFFEFPPTKESNTWLSLAPAGGGEVRPLLKDYRGSVLKSEWASDSKSLVVLSVEGTHEVIARVDIDTGAFDTVTEVTRSQWGASLSTNGATIAYLAQTPQSADDVWVIEKNRQPRRLTDFNPQTKSWAFGKVSEVVWKNSKDALVRRGVLITPPDYRPGNLYPVVVNTHPGDTAWWTGFHASRWWDWGQLLASHGYVVFLPNTRGVTGEGGALHATIDDWGEMAFQDLMDGVDHLIGQRIADPDRLGIGGWSNGGFMTEYTITRTTRFKAAVAQAAHSDFFSLYGTSYLRGGLRRKSQESPYHNRQWYDGHSPITLVKNCRTPTLLLHGEFDRGVPAGQAHEFYTGLKDAGVEAELVIYPREGHSIQEYSHRIDLLKRMLTWFDKHLK